MARKRTNSGETPVKYSDFGTAELRARGGVEYTTTADGFSQARRLNQLTIDYYYNRGIIDDHQYNAAKRLLEDFRISGLEPSVKSCLNLERGGNAKMTLSELQIDARNRFMSIMYHMLPRNESIVTHWLVLDDSSKNELAEISKKLSYQAVSALRSALNSIDKFYRTYRH